MYTFSQGAYHTIFPIVIGFYYTVFIVLVIRIIVICSLSYTFTTVDQKFAYKDSNEKQHKT